MAPTYIMAFLKCHVFVDLIGKNKQHYAHASKPDRFSSLAPKALFEFQHELGQNVSHFRSQISFTLSQFFHYIKIQSTLLSKKTPNQQKFNE